MTPARLRFYHYGHYRIVVTKPGFEKVEKIERVRAPIYQYFPLDFIAEFLWPGKIRDERRFSYKLTRAKLPEADELIKRARKSLEKLPPASTPSSRSP